MTMSPLPATDAPRQEELGSPAAPAAPSWVFDTPGSDKEPFLATDAKDASRVLLTWAQDVGHVWAAATKDGGRNWTQRLLDDGSCAAAMNGCQDGFDSVAAYGPDGSLYVQFGHGGGPDGFSGGGITVAASKDDGATWTYHKVNLAPDVWDAMDFAVVPDTGHLYVVAQSIAHRSIGLWRSVDGSVTWTPMLPANLQPTAVASGAAPAEAIFWPRVAAGSGGLVVLTAKSFAGGERFAVSHDEAATFSPWTRPALGEESGSLVGNPIAIGADGKVDLVFATESTLYRVAPLAGPQVTDEVVLDGRKITWPASARDANGTLHTLVSHSAADEDWGVTLVDWRAGNASLRALVPPTGKSVPAHVGSGDEYGGLAAAADGHLWAAWADSRGDSVRVVVTRLDA